MNPPWWGIPVLLVVGAAIILGGWWWDRRRQRAASEGFTTEEDLAAAAPPPGIPEDRLGELLASRGPEPTFPAGLADRAFLTHPQRGVAAVVDPYVVVTDTDLDDERLLLHLLDAAHTHRRALVLVAPGFGPRTGWQLYTPGNDAQARSFSVSPSASQRKPASRPSRVKSSGQGSADTKVSLCKAVARRWNSTG